MNPLDYAVVIIIIVFSFKLLDAWLKHRRAAGAVEDRGELLKRLDALEERVKVLERIVTDERFDLRQEFKNLGT